jgi:hypothetical protein
MLRARHAANTALGISDNLILLVGCVVFFFVLLLPEPGAPSIYFTVLQGASATLKGYVSASDINQDIIGAQGLLLRRDPYPAYTPANPALGYEEFAAGHASTHPPTTFLFTLPIALLPQKLALAIWAWFMLLLLVLTLKCYGWSWKVALGLTPLLLLWTPIQISLGQVTILWLFGVSVAYRFRNERPFLSGASIAFASLTKFLPGLLIIAFFMKKQWRALLGFTCLWLAILLVLTLLFPGTINRYLEINQTTSLETIQRADNSALLFSSYRSGGWLGAGLAAVFLLAILVANRDCLLDRQPGSAPRFWRVLIYFSVVLLPIAWIYSIVPLLPIIAYQVFQKKLLVKLVGLCCIVLPCIAPPWGDLSVLPMMVVMILVGAGLLFDALPYRIFTATSLADFAQSATATE